MAYEREPKREVEASPVQQRLQRREGGRQESQIDLEKTYRAAGLFDLPATPEASPNADKAVGDAAAPALMLWAQRMDQAAETIELELLQPTPSHERIEAIVHTIENDPSKTFLVGALAQVKNLTQLPYGRLVSSLWHLEDSLRVANRRLEDIAAASSTPKPAPIRASHSRHVATHVIEKVGYKNMTQVPLYKVAGPPAHTAGVAAKKLLDAAVADAQSMEAGFDSRRSQVEQRRAAWTNTLDALRSTIPELTPEQRKLLAPQVQDLHDIVTRIVAKERALANPPTNFELSKREYVNKLVEAVK